MNPALYQSPRITKPGNVNLAEYLNGDGVTAEYDFEPTLDKYLIFFYIGTKEYQSTVLAHSHDEAIDAWCRDNPQGEDPEAVRLDDCERNY